MFNIKATGAQVPAKATTESAGFDLFNPRQQILFARQTTKIDLGLSVTFPKDTHGRIVDRSSMALRNLFVVGGMLIHVFIFKICLKIFFYFRLD